MKIHRWIFRASSAPCGSTVHHLGSQAQNLSCLSLHRVLRPATGFFPSHRPSGTVCRRRPGLRAPNFGRASAPRVRECVPYRGTRAASHALGFKALLPVLPLYQANSRRSDQILSEAIGSKASRAHPARARPLRARGRGAYLPSYRSCHRSCHRPPRRRGRADGRCGVR